MFSANENLMLRQHKRRIVNRVEQTMPEEALDMGTTVMVMQVSCKDPGCVPLETAVIIIFPKCGDEELVPGLPESVGGSYKTKILKPMADVTEDDILDNLPPAFEGGRRTMERVCMYARDVMIGQITQLFGDGSDDKEDSSDAKDRREMAKYLQACLDDYIAAGCKPPPFGEPFAGIETATIPTSSGESNETKSSTGNEPKGENPQSTTTTATAIPSQGNIVIRRKTDHENDADVAAAAAAAAATTPPPPHIYVGNGTTTSVRIRQPPRHERAIQQALGQPARGMRSSSTISSLFEREHAPGIRKPGCPCCNPDDPAALADSFLMM